MIGIELRKPTLEHITYYGISALVTITVMMVLAVDGHLSRPQVFALMAGTFACAFASMFGIGSEHTNVSWVVNTIVFCSTAGLVQYFTA